NPSPKIYVIPVGISIWNWERPLKSGTLNAELRYSLIPPISDPQSQIFFPFGASVAAFFLYYLLASLRPPRPLNTSGLFCVSTTP
ncbi:MAG: hypothetical protein ACPGRX_06975, partial [Bdellovibrionales bacterium]